MDAQGRVPRHRPRELVPRPRLAPARESPIQPVRSPTQYRKDKTTGRNDERHRARSFNVALVAVGIRDEPYNENQGDDHEPEDESYE